MSLAENSDSIAQSEHRALRVTARCAAARVFLSHDRKDSPPFVKYFLMNYFEHFEAPLSFIEKNFQVIEIVWHS